RYSYPVYDAANTNAYKRIHPEFQDSIFVKWFFNSQEQPTGSWTDMALMPKNIDAYLKYSPAKRSYSIGSNSVQGDMAAMFVPTDAALENYFNSDAGRTLKERYGTWDNVPNQVLDILINHHMMQSFLNATPSRFVALADNMGTSMGAKPSDVRYSGICSNGIVYVTDVVYAPTKYVAVTGPVLMGAKTTIFNWIVNQLQYDLYLLSMEPGNRFSFFVPTDDMFTNYVDPYSVANKKPETLHFFIDPKDNSMKASQWVNGDSIGVYSSSFSEKPSEKTKGYLDYLMMDIMDNHIVLEDVVPDKKYYRTKTGGTIVVTGQGSGNLKVAGGSNIDRGEDISVINTYHMQNGTTYLLDKVVQMPLTSASAELKTQDDFSEFYDLCFEVKEIKEGSKKVAGGLIFGGNGKGIDENVRFFNTYHYTVYVPTNEAVRKAIADKLIMRWSDIEALKDLDYSRYLSEATNLYDFLSYHFQDNSVYVSDKFETPVEYETANLERRSDGSPTGKFRKLKVFADGASLSVQGAGNASPVHVQTSDPLYYNRMVRDYQFATNNTLTTSSFAVIHQIDEVLKYK
ncbi:MAG: fasciclin domain-containing protein, partial [Dysgonamonadaceae bacterium]|nr:fasciclin domain-containing protein [Dysgonamonadaceae bacterium]